MNCNFRSLRYTFFLLFIASTTLAGETSIRNYPLPDHGSIQFEVPAQWEDSLIQPPDRLPPTIKFTQKTGRPFSMLVTPIWPLNEKVNFPEGDDLRRSVQKAADRISSQSVEKTIVVKKLIGAPTYGYYFSATDRAPKPEEYKYLTQGEVRIGDLIATFTILTNDGQDSIVSAGLALMKSAKQSKETTATQTETIQIRELKKVFKLTHPSSRLLMNIPKGGLSLAQNTLGGSADNPRYFYFQDEALKLNISGWFEPAQNFLGIKKFWENETKGWKRKGLPDPQNVSFMKIANWDVVVYDMIIPSGSNSHIRAHWLQAGTWIDIHISITSDAPNSEIRTKLLALLKTFEVTEKK